MNILIKSMTTFNAMIRKGLTQVVLGRLIFAAVLTTISLSVFTCQTGPEQTSVELECADCKGKGVRLIRYDAVADKDVVITQARFDSAGIADFKVDLPYDVGVAIEMGDTTFYGLFLFEGEKNEIAVTGKKVLFGRKHAPFYKHLEEFRKPMDSLSNSIYALKMSPTELSSKEREPFFKTIDTAFEDLKRSVNTDAKLIKKDKEILLFYAASYQRSVMTRFDESETDEDYARWRKNGNEANGFAPDFFRDVTLPPQPGLENLFAFPFIVIYEIRQNLHGPIWFHLSESDQDFDHGTVALRSAEVIIKKGFPESLTELLLTQNLNIYLANKALTASGQQVYDQFLARYPKSERIPVLKQRYAQARALLEGQPAKDFYAFKQNGEKVQLSSLKGKIVYVDFWATWCGPCVEEFPYSRNLIKQFKNDKDVVFMFVSSDSDAGKWKKYLATEKKIDGLHLNYKEEGDSIYDYYKIGGIPHYMLIDEFGRIKSSDATRPSDPDTGKTIAAMLAAKRGR